MIDYEILPATTRVWVYQASKTIPESIIPEVKQHLSNFTQSWVSHNNQLRAFSTIYHNQFIVLMVDESLAGASGCSIDKSVHFIKQLEQHYNIDLFDRMIFTYMEGEEIRSVPRIEFSKLYQLGEINDKTLVFDNLVKNKGEFETKWLKPLGKSWHQRMI